MVAEWGRRGAIVRRLLCSPAFRLPPRPVTVSRMARKPAIYKGHESARMAELEGAPLASFAARGVAFAIDMAIAAVSFVGVGMAGALAAVKLGWMRDEVRISFDPFHHEHWQSVIYFVVFIAASNYIGNGATLGKKTMKIRALSLSHRRLSSWHSMERSLGYGASAWEGFFGFFNTPPTQTTGRCTTGLPKRLSSQSANDTSDCPGGGWLPRPICLDRAEGGRGSVLAGRSRQAASETPNKPHTVRR